MSTQISQNWTISDQNAVRHALMIERMRAGHYREEWARAKDKRLRGLCGRKIDACLARAVQLALALVDMGQEVPTTGVRVDFDDRLLDAMDATLNHTASVPTTRTGPRDARAGRVHRRRRPTRSTR